MKYSYSSSKVIVGLVKILMSKMPSTTDPTRKKRRISAGSVFLTVVLIVVGWVAVRYFLGWRDLGYVDSAIVTMRTLVEDENKFAETHPNLGYSCKLADITSEPAIASGRRNGYIFEISDCRPNPEGGPNTSYTLTARPLHLGMPVYCSNESRVLKADYDGSLVDCLKHGQPF